MREGTGIRFKLAAMAPEARKPAIPVVEILSERANQHHLGVVPWVTSPLFVAGQDTERRPGLSVAGSSAASHDLCAAEAETQEVLGKLNTARRPPNVFRPGYLAWEAAPELVKYTIRRLLERCSSTLSVTQPHGSDQPVMQLLESQTDLAFRGNRRGFEISARTRSDMMREIRWNRLFRISPRPCFRHKFIIDQSIDVLGGLQTLSLEARSHVYLDRLDNCGAAHGRSFDAGASRPRIIRNDDYPKKELIRGWLMYP